MTAYPHLTCTSLPGLRIPYCRVPGTRVSSVPPDRDGCRACEREMLRAARTPTRDMRPVRWLKIEELI